MLFLKELASYLKKYENLSLNIVLAYSGFSQIDFMTKEDPFNGSKRRGGPNPNPSHGLLCQKLNCFQVTFVRPCEQSKMNSAHVFLQDFLAEIIRGICICA